MNKIYLAKQKIVNRQGNIFAHELLYRDNEFGVNKFKSNIHSTSNVLHAVLTNIDMDELLGNNSVAFINLDEKVLISGLIDLLDKNRFVLEVLETTELTQKAIEKLVHYYGRGFKIAIDDFDCSTEMFKKFTPIFKYIHILKIDVQAASLENIKASVPKFKKMGIKLLAEKIETEEEHVLYKDIGFDLFQGYQIDTPVIVQVERYKDVTQISIVRLIKLIRNNGSPIQIEDYVKQSANLTFKLMKFLNNQKLIDGNIDSITQVIRLLGRDRLLRWLKLYLYSEFTNNPVSVSKMNIARSRAEKMQKLAKEEDKNKAYMAGMFSMLGSLFDKDIKDVIKGLPMNQEVHDLVVLGRGKLLSDFKKTEVSEKLYLKKLMNDHFDKIDLSCMIDALEVNGVKIKGVVVAST